MKTTLGKAFRSGFWSALCLVFGLALLTIPSMAQLSTGQIIGRVVDETEAVVPGADVTITNMDTGRTRETVTSDIGEFVVYALPSGKYRVSVSLQGFREFVQEGVLVEVNRVARVNVRLQVGETRQTITVTGDAPLVESVQATVSHIVEKRQILELPLSGRNTVELVQLVPGVTGMSTGSGLGYTEYRVSTGGASAFNTQFLIDGGTNTSAFRNTGNVLPNPDAIEEFRVIRNMDAEYGRLGGVAINTVTRSGTNRFNATLFHFHRNRALNATAWHLNDTNPLVQNQFGGSAGGPIVGDRTFFFFSYQQLERRSAVVSTSARPPTALERQGDFSQSADKPIDPETGEPFPGALIPPDRIDVVSRNVIDQFVPLPNRSDGRWQGMMSEAYNDKHFLIKVDHDLAEQHHLAFNLLRGSSYQPNPFAGGNIPYGLQVFEGTQHSIGLSENWTISPTQLNHLRLGYLRTVGLRFITPELGLKDLGGNFEPDDQAFLPELNISGRMRLRTRFLGPTYDNTYQLTDTFNWLSGRHNIKFGGEVTHLRGSNYSGLWSNGWYDFNGAFSGDEMADFLLGISSRVHLSSVNRMIGHHSYYGLFAQDNFQARPGLTLNLGLRYEIFTPSINPNDWMSTYIPGHQSTTVEGAPPGLAFLGEPGVPRKLRNYDKDNFGPRIGVAWDVTGDGRTSVRAGFGLSYTAMTTNSQPVNTPPYSFNTFYFGVQFSDPWAKANNGVPLLPFAFSPNDPVFFFPTNINAMDQNWSDQYFRQFNLTIQRQLGKSYLFEFGYFGNQGRDLRTQQQLNEALFIPGESTGGNVQQRRPIFPEYYSNISVNMNLNYSDYHSMQLTLKKRFADGFSFDGNYVLSKSTGLAQNNPATYYNWDLEHGRSGDDARHRFIMSFIWQPTWARGLDSAVVRHILDGWQLSGILQFRSGTPLTITAGQDINLNGHNTDRPNLNGDPALDPNRPRAEVAAQWFEKSVFSKPATGALGTAGRSVVDGPGRKGFDLGINRNIRFAGQRLQFRAEFFNTFNWVNLNNPTTNFRSGNFAKITSAGSPRVIQFGLKLFLNEE